MQPVADTLKPIAFRLLLLRLAGWAALCVIGLGIAFCGLELLEKTLVFKETTAVWLNLAFIGVCGIVLLLGLFRVYRNQPKLMELSNRVEEAHPELMDSFNAAVEVSSIPASKRTTI